MPNVLPGPVAPANLSSIPATPGSRVIFKASAGSIWLSLRPIPWVLTLTSSTSSGGFSLSPAANWPLRLLAKLVIRKPSKFTFVPPGDVTSMSSTDPGGPVEDIDVTSPGGTNVNFDGFLITNFANNLKGQFAAGDKENPPDDVEDVNVSTQGIGLKDNQMDPAEALKMTLDPGVAGIELKFAGATGPGKTFGIKIEAYDANGVLIFSETTTNDAPKGSNELVKTWNFPDEAVEVYIGLDLGTNSGVRIAEVAVIERVEIPDFELNYTVTAVDGDTDFTPADFTVQIDGNNDGVL